MPSLSYPVAFSLLLPLVLAYDPTFAFDSHVVEVENRTLSQIYQAALSEGGTVVLWHGGDETNQQDALKEAFEARFPGMSLNLTVDLSKYHDSNIDTQLATDNLTVDSAILQTVHDYPRWKLEGALKHYIPLDFESIYDAFKDEDGAYYGMYVFGWSNVWNTEYVSQGPVEFTDYLKSEFKNKLVLTYPNDDDAVLYAFYLIMQQYGTSWFDSLLSQNPRWVRGTGTPATLMASSNGSYTASFTGSIGLVASSPFNISYPTQGQFVSWPQTGAIFKDAPHPEGAKLLHNYILSQEYQNKTGSWSVRTDMTPPGGKPKIMEMPGTDPTKFMDFMLDRPRVERLRFWFEERLGSAQGKSPLIDDL
ncbi:MAG: hypothetical protein M1834_000835 [Cirrosporium novae-zelandiae]|nr:MAG: hypothetical protein M1834_000835 [Cirrosporium novae-zelandiae]